MTSRDIENILGRLFSTFEESAAKIKGDEIPVPCLLHNDTKPSMSVNRKTGLWFCHACSEGGDIYKLYSFSKDIPVSKARKELTELTRTPVSEEKQKAKELKAIPVSDAEVVKKHEDLLAIPDAMSFLLNNCGWTEETIVKFKIGWENGKFIIPIRENGKLVNLRKYSPGAASNKYTGVHGHNEARLWPVENFEQNDIYLMEGEKDCILAIQHGLNAVTVVGGAGTFKNSWINLFRDKNVYIIYDIDVAGRNGAGRISDLITNITKSCRNVLLPIKSPENGDFTDFIMQGHSVEELRDLCEKTKIEDKIEFVDKTIGDEVIDTTLDTAAYSDTTNKRIRMRVRVTGKQLSPFLIPKEIVVPCGRAEGEICAQCMISIRNLEKYTVDERFPEVLKMFRTTDAKHDNAIWEILQYEKTCPKAVPLVTQNQYIEEVNAIATIDFWTDSKQYVVRTLYFMNIQAHSNKDYLVEAVTLPMPDSKECIHLVYKAEPCQSSIEEFKMTPEMFEQLRIFQCQA